MIPRSAISQVIPIRSLGSVLIRSFSSSTSQPRHYSNKFQAANMGDNLSNFDLFATMTKPDNNIEMISKDSIIFTNLKVIKSPNEKNEPIGALLLSNQTFEINLKDCTIRDRIMVHFDDKILKLLEIVHPKPELMVIGLGGKPRMLSPETKDAFKRLGIKMEVGSTKNSVLNYDLLATERSPDLVGALIFPPNV